MNPAVPSDGTAPGWWLTAFCAALVAVGPVLRARELGAKVMAGLAVVAVVAVVAHQLAGLGRWQLRLGISAVAATSAFAIGAVRLGLWTGAAVGLADWAIARRPALPGRPRPPRSLATPAVLGISVAAAGSRLPDPFPLAAAGLGFGLAALVLATFAPAAYARIAGVASTVVASKVGRVALALVLVGGVATGGVLGYRALRTKEPPRDVPTNDKTDPAAVPAALAKYPWYPAYARDISWLWSTPVAWDPLAPVRLKDVHSETVNIEDGARKTWRPPECGCRRLTVWVYGGSTTFGLGQRDEYTIPSQLARAAWAHGIALDAFNRGVVGDTQWEEANRFAWDLATLPKPDLVVFYDGINDSQAIDRIKVKTRQPMSFVKDDFWQDYLKHAGNAGMNGRWAPNPDTGYIPEGASRVVPEPLEFHSAPEIGKVIAERYETARKIARWAAAANKVAAEWVWQPSIEFRPAIGGEPAPSGRSFAKDEFTTALSLIGKDVHDESGAFDGVSDALYWDQFHVNEEGAEIAGAKLFDDLESRLRKLGGGR